MDSSLAESQIDLVRLSPSDAGEVLTLQRAAYVTEAQVHQDLFLPPLTQSLDQLEAELTDAGVLGLGLREETRLLAAVRVRVEGDNADLGRLAVAPDRQRQGLGSRLIREAEEQVLEHYECVKRLRLFTGQYSPGNQRLYERNGYSEVHRSSGGNYQLVHMTKVLRQHD
jgi:GNAT superfamily N-acetyltransferase